MYTIFQNICFKRLRKLCSYHMKAHCRGSDGCKTHILDHLIIFQSNLRKVLTYRCTHTAKDFRFKVFTVWQKSCHLNSTISPGCPVLLAHVNVYCESSLGLRSPAPVQLNFKSSAIVAHIKVFLCVPFNLSLSSHILKK
uniref:Uncharacterized protein n=1 Tax=Rhipicephalus appendiculatus TaxID=34631 RepID=A0A131YBG1_RHIAP